MNQTRRQTAPSLFSKRLRRLMEEKGLTIREAAKAVEVPISTLDGWRSGATPEDFEAVQRLAHLLGVTLSFLLVGKDDTRPEGQVPSITEIFDDGGQIFDGFAKITIQRLLPKNRKDSIS